MPDTNVQYSNLPGVIVHKNDGNLLPKSPATGPRLVVIGQAGKGQGDDPYIVRTTTLAKGEFGTEGTLLRGMWEALEMGAEEVALYRIGATPAILSGIGNNGGTGGYVVETVERDADAGGDYALYYDDSEDRLVVKRNSDDLIVYDNDDTNPIDLFEVSVSGYRASVGGPDIGSASSFIDLENVDSSTYPGTSFTAGGDGLDLSRMELYEKLYVAYEDLKRIDFDVVVPMDVYLDDYNVVAQGHYIGAVTPEATGSNAYPEPGAYRPGQEVDSLGKLYVEEYEGQYYFWWWFNDGTGVFAAADIYPASGPGAASSTLKIDGTALSASDFHEVNFGYQLARFLYEYSTNTVDATGVIGVLPPSSTRIVDIARWLGKAPTWTLNSSTGESYIASAGHNGSGLLGNKFMVGRNNHRSGKFGGGFIATDGQFMDSGAEIDDDNDVPIDLGKYISVTVDYPVLRNNFSSTSYISSFAASYAGFYINMDPKSAPTNKKVTSASIVYRVGIPGLNALAGAGYVALRQKSSGLVISDAPMATMPTSDWKRLSTVRIVKTIVDACRESGERFLGESFNSTNRAGLETAIEQILSRGKKTGILNDYKPFTIIQTADMAVEGKADIALTLVPAFELRQITFTVSLAKQI